MVGSLIGIMENEMILVNGMSIGMSIVMKSPEHEVVLIAEL